MRDRTLLFLVVVRISTVFQYFCNHLKKMQTGAVHGFYINQHTVVSHQRRIEIKHRWSLTVFSYYVFSIKREWSCQVRRSVWAFMLQGKQTSTNEAIIATTCLRSIVRCDWQTTKLRLLTHNPFRSLNSQGLIIMASKLDIRQWCSIPAKLWAPIDMCLGQRTAASSVMEFDAFPLSSGWAQLNVIDESSAVQCEL